MKGRLNPAEFAEAYLPEVTVDTVLLTITSDGKLCTFVSKRQLEPFLGSWALPGVFVQRDETLETAAQRALSDKARIPNVFVEQLYTFGDLKRDPRGRILSVAYYALVPEDRFYVAMARNHEATVATIDVPWEGSAGGPVQLLDVDGNRLKLAFDHDRIIGLAVQRIRGKLNYTNIGFELLPDEFTLFELQRIYEAVLGHRLNKDSFRRKMLSSGLIEDTGNRRGGTSYRPASLFRFKKQEN